ncbi:MAG: amidohydrolase family protein, partial [Slackia sp.]|nr:amidohydrolase family protein [Slackia sp.]
MSGMLLCAEHIIPVTQPPIDDGAVLVRDGRIVEIGGAQRMKARYPEEEVRDFGRAAIMPGFVDCHTHLEYTVLRGIVHDVPYAEWLAHEHAKADMMTRDDRYDSALLGGMEMLSGGVTTVADFTGTGASREAARDLGLRSVIYRSVGVPDKAKVDSAIKAAVEDVQAWSADSDPAITRVGIAPKAL